MSGAKFGPMRVISSQNCSTLVHGAVLGKKLEIVPHVHPVESIDILHIHV